MIWEHALVMVVEVVDGVLLRGGEGGGEGEFLSFAGFLFVGGGESAACLARQGSEGVDQSAGEDEGGLHIGQRVEHGGLSVEIGGEPATQVAVQQGIQSDGSFAGEVGAHDVAGQGQVVAVLVAYAFAPAAAHGGQPPGLAGAGVLPAGRVDVPARGE